MEDKKETLHEKLDRVLKENNLVIELKPVLRLQSNGIYGIELVLNVKEKKGESNG